MPQTKNKTNSILIGLLTIAAIILVVYAIYAYSNKTDQPGELDEFAICLKDRGTVFYGAFWCTHCQDQKKAFGSSEKLIPYVECSTPDGKNQTQTCIDKNITSYPTWIFGDDSRETGALSMQQIAEKSGCQLPQ